MYIHIMYLHASEESMTSSNLTYGLASRDRIAAMTGKQILQAIIEGEFPQAPISQALTFWIVEVSDGFAAFEGEPGPHLLNPMGAASLCCFRDIQGGASSRSDSIFKPDVPGPSSS